MPARRPLPTRPMARRARPVPGSAMAQTRPGLILVLAAAVLAPLGCVDAPASGETGRVAGTLVRIDGLGALTFDNSGAPAAQEAFHRGVLLMHSFEYEDAAAAFREAQEIDPEFALAYWGEAMTHTHPVWNDKDRDAAVTALDRYAPTPEARAEKAPTPREASYLAAVDVLYGEGGSKERLDTLYSRAMADLTERYPDDPEARAFHALSLLGLSQGDRNVPTYMEAGAHALDLFEANPEHPGAAHYVIHSFDDPTHAPLGLEAAEAYAAIAPDAAHAQHMTTHIFLALGLWDDVVAANERADAVVDRARAGNDLPATSCGHYNQWLQYGYQQQGRLVDAAALLEACRTQAAEGAQGAPASHALMRGYYLGDGGSSELATVGAFDRPLEDPAPGAELLYVVGDGLAAAEAGDRNGLGRALVALEGIDPSVHDRLGGYVRVWGGVLEALELQLRGRLDAALARAHYAAEDEAAMPVDFGPPGAMRPAREVEADLLMALGRPDEAMSAYRTQLERTPNRIRTLTGYARAAVAAGHEAVAEQAYRTLVELLDGADADFGPRLEAEAYLGGQA